MIGRPRLARENLAAVDDHELIAVENRALFIDCAEAVGITVEGEADIGVIRRYRGHQLLQVFRLRGVGMMIRKMPIHIEEQLNGVAVQFFQNAPEYGSGCAIACIGHNFDTARQAELTRDFVHIRRRDIEAFQSAGAGDEILRFDDLTNLLNFLAVNRALAMHHFEAVVVGGIVASGDHDAGFRVQMEYRIIEQRRGHDAEISHFAAGFEQAGEQRGVQTGGTQTAVACEIDFARGFARIARIARSTGARQVGPERPAQGAHAVVGEFFIRNAANIVFAKNVWRKHSSEV